MKTGTEAITTLGALREALRDYTTPVTTEIDRAECQWAGLVRAGGGRDDHAATLLTELRKRLAQLATFAGRVAEQIDYIQQHPFGE